MAKRPRQGGAPAEEADAVGTGNGAASPPPRKRGRPPRTIDRGAVIKAVERLFSEGGIDAVSIERTAEEINVSRATLYRTVPSKEHLLGMLFEQMTQDLDRAAHAATDVPGLTPLQRLEALIRAQIDGAVRMRHYLFVYFDGSWLPPGIYDNWRRWTHEYEQHWLKIVRDTIHDGALPPGDPLVTTRLILGMTIWVANWYRPRAGYSPDEVADHAIRLIDITAAQGATNKR